MNKSGKIYKSIFFFGIKLKIFRSWDPGVSLKRRDKNQEEKYKKD